MDASPQRPDEPIFEYVARRVVNGYYQQFDQDRSGLGPLYRAHSMLTFEGSPHLGVEGILEKLTQLPFQRIQHRVETLNAQPSIPNLGGVIVMVTGALLTDEEQNPINFTQVFHLLPENPAEPAWENYYVFNDIFKLVYPGS